MRRKRYRCDACGVKYFGKKCPECAGTVDDFIKQLQQDAIATVVENGNLTQEQADAVLIKVKEFLATHWTERECPRHEIMEAVCHIGVLV